MSKKHKKRNYDKMMEEEDFFQENDLKYRKKRKTRRNAKHKLDGFARQEWYDESDLDELDHLNYEDSY